VLAGAPPEPPSSPSRPVAASFPPFDPSSSPARGKQLPLPSFPSYCAQFPPPRAHRSDRAAPLRCWPPVRPDRARRARNRVCKRLRVVLPQPVVEEMARSAVEGLRRRAAAARRRAAPVSGDIAAARRMYLIRAVRSRANGQDRVPFRLKRDGPRWTHGPRLRPGPRCTHAPSAVGSQIHGVEWRFCLRVPGNLNISKPVLPPLKIITVRS
jgi:hypothetical protein